uniref:Glycosyl hydrolase n=1 Tax=Eiseniibacteriota bacterium TaxID=2212470 RepID=A0A832I1G6_UNCEI
MPHRFLLAPGLALMLVLGASASAAPAARNSAPDAANRMTSESFRGLAFRALGPALLSGRVGDIAIHPDQPFTWYVAVSSGNLWKTVNAGTTWEPIFDDHGSYSIGCVTIDPKRPLIVWLGTGENNSQRSVGYGDGVYKSLDAGKSWTKVGLAESGHIGKILVDPRDPDVVYVAAMGPLWSSGGDRGLYKTTDGGATWTRVLYVDAWTGVSDLAFDPRDPDVLYAVSYQRSRRVWTLLNGGPGSGLWKSVDAGRTWKRLEKGLPKEHLGRIGIAVGPADPDRVYAIVEAANRTGGIYVSTDAGENWEKRSDYVSSSPQYYQELFCDPQDPDRVYSMDVYLQCTEDGGRTWKRVGEKSKHVDNHALWIDPRDTRHLIVGCDGGLYESWDRGQNWDYKPNLPVTQFYKICVDNDWPIYNVYGGTQDNNTMGGPSRTFTAHGITNQDWFVTLGGDGFQPRVDPTDPNIVYTQLQHGVIVRFDRRTGERVSIQPQAAPGEEPLRWNWDSPLIISPHAPTRLYFAAQRLFRSDDRGDSWRPVSGDLTRRLDRNRMKVMDRVWSVDAVAKNASTSFYGNIVSLSESPRVEGLIYVGTDDGLVQVTEDGGATWRRVERFPGVPELAYVSRLEASRHDPSTVYAAFDHHKAGDYRPYVLMSRDRGRSWTSIAGDLPARGHVLSLAEDPVNPDLLFCGTEFGVYFTPDRGRRWVRLKGNLPTIAMRDLAIQEREGDLVLGTFGRGIYVLDDYTPLRSVSDAMLAEPWRLFPVRPTTIVMPSNPLGGRDKSTQGESFFTAPNPPFGAVFTYWLRDDLTTREERRRKAERAVFDRGGDVFYPSWDSLRAEAREEAPAILLLVSDEDGRPVTRLSGPVKKGFHRVAWDLRHPSPEPFPRADRGPWVDPFRGPLALPGTYQVTLARRVEGRVDTLAGPVRFTVQPPLPASLPPPDRAEVLAFQKRVARLQRAVLGAQRVVGEARQRITQLKLALDAAPAAAPALADEARALETRLADLEIELSGDAWKASKNEPVPLSIRDRLDEVVDGSWSSTGAVTGTHRREADTAARLFAELMPRLRALVERDLPRLEADADRAGAPWTPGRSVPEWSPE